MKKIQKIVASLVLGFILFICSDLSKGEIYYGPTGDGAVIVCSDSNYGRCFNEYANWCSYYTVVTMECKWTGFQSSYCSIILVKAYNICMDYLL
jgi:hypothetical protein